MKYYVEKSLEFQWIGRVCERVYKYFISYFGISSNYSPKGKVWGS